MTSEKRWDNNEMYTDNDGQTWRSFARHYPSGDVYILEQDQPYGESANYTAVDGPIHHSEITRTFLEEIDLEEASQEDIDWAVEQTWEPVSLDQIR